MKINYPTQRQIRARAYQIYLQRGCQPGYDRDDWLQAEYELLRLPIRKVVQFHSFSGRVRDEAQAVRSVAGAPRFVSAVADVLATADL